MSRIREDINAPSIIDLKKEIYRYLRYWPYFLISLVLIFSLIYTYLRYQDLIYESSAKIQILDDSMDQDMALPTAMTIFNRSNVNLENDIYKLKSLNLIEKSVSKVNYNVEFHTSGIIKSFQNHRSDWLNSAKYNIDFLTNSMFLEKSEFIFNFEKNSFSVKVIKDDIVIDEYNFRLSTSEKKNNLPFIFEIFDESYELIADSEFYILVKSFDRTVNNLSKTLNIAKLGLDSELLIISMRHQNPTVSRELIDTLIDEFDRDGVNDRQLVYQRTIDFVDSRFELLESELNEIEFNKENFKVQNELSYIESDATISSQQKTIYSEELFNYDSQLELLNILYDEINNNENEFIPINIGIENSEINILILKYNELMSTKLKLNYSAGANNVILKNVNKELSTVKLNINASINTYENTIKSKIKVLTSRKNSYDYDFSNLPKNERLLRKIEREQNIKESLFLLLLQKREEASINYAVTKPSIKIIDKATTSFPHIYPNHATMYLFAFIISLFLPFMILFFKFYFDNKLHVRDDITSKIDIPIIAEIPFLKKENIINDIHKLKSDSRDVLTESIRMLNANLKFRFIDKKDKSAKTLLVTSSIKGEGKTIVSISLSKVLSFSSDKVILIGGDLRNPQLHKYFKKNKSNLLGLSDFISRADLKWRDLIAKSGNLDVLFSGTIPPNPTELLNSDKFKDLMIEAKNEYDYVIIDSAPCLLVSDTLQISKLTDGAIYLVRSNYTEKSLLNFISELSEENRLKNINIVFNSVGSSKQYGYDYGYKYGYKYSYNYGYGYGYSADKD